MENVVSARSASMRERIAMYNANALKIGIFGANCSSGRSATKVPERWSASWPDCRRLARMVGLGRALGDERVRAPGDRIAHQEFQLAGFVAAGGEARAVVALDP